ncbi:MAG: sugar phosphate isomerase/epimerase, partial [Anaerolineaceae bacterium]|nr:sugar phosphate isomerase/epimerase [Anaerolineaceae bacterium]
DLAAQYGLTVELEYVPIAAVRDLAGVVNVLTEINRENAGILIDIHHFHRAGDKPEVLAKLPRNWFHMAHLCDAEAEIPTSREEMIYVLRENRAFLGEGGIDIKPILAALPPVPYSIELPRLSYSAKYGYKAHAQKCLDSAKSYLGIE